MVNQIILDYLKTNKDKYDISDLKGEILSKGYSVGDFNEALFVVNNLEPTKFKPGEINKLPSPTYVGEKKKSFSFLKFLFFLFMVLLLGAVAVIALNYFKIDFFGWNLFNYFS